MELDAVGQAVARFEVNPYNGIVCAQRHDNN